MRAAICAVGVVLSGGVLWLAFAPPRPGPRITAGAERLTLHGRGGGSWPWSIFDDARVVTVPRGGGTLLVLRRRGRPRGVLGWLRWRQRWKHRAVSLPLSALPSRDAARLRVLVDERLASNRPDDAHEGP